MDVETDLVDAYVDGLDERRIGVCELRRPRLEDLVLGMTIGEHTVPRVFIIVLMQDQCSQLYIHC